MSMHSRINLRDDSLSSLLAVHPQHRQGCPSCCSSWSHLSSAGVEARSGEGGGNPLFGLGVRTRVILRQLPSPSPSESKDAPLILSNSRLRLTTQRDCSDTQHRSGWPLTEHVSTCAPLVADDVHRNF